MYLLNLIQFYLHFTGYHLDPRLFSMFAETETFVA